MVKQKKNDNNVAIEEEKEDNSDEEAAIDEMEQLAEKDLRQWCRVNTYVSKINERIEKLKSV